MHMSLGGVVLQGHEIDVGNENLAHVWDVEHGQCCIWYGW